MCGHLNGSSASNVTTHGEMLVACKSTALSEHVSCEHKQPVTSLFCSFRLLHGDQACIEYRKRRGVCAQTATSL